MITSFGIAVFCMSQQNSNNKILIIMCKIQIDGKTLPFSEPAKWENINVVISQILSHCSPCTRITSVAVETTQISKDVVLEEEVIKQKADYDNGLREQIENFVKARIKKA